MAFNGIGVSGGDDDDDDREIKPIRQEKTIEIMVEEIREKIIEMPQIQYLEKIVEYIKPVIQYKIKEVRRPVYIERIVHVPKILEEEKIVEVPQIRYVEKIVEVPTYVYKERIVEVPVPMIRETIIPVLRVQRVEREVEIPTVPLLTNYNIVDSNHMFNDNSISENNEKIVSTELNCSITTSDSESLELDSKFENDYSNSENANDGVDYDLVENEIQNNNLNLAVNKVKTMFGLEEQLKSLVGSWRSWRSWSFTGFKTWAEGNIKSTQFKPHKSDNEDKNVVDKYGKFGRRRQYNSRRIITNVNADADKCIKFEAISKIPPTKTIINSDDFADFAKFNKFSGNCYMRGFIHAN